MDRWAHQRLKGARYPEPSQHTVSVQAVQSQPAHRLLIIVVVIFMYCSLTAVKPNYPSDFLSQLISGQRKGGCWLSHWLTDRKCLVSEWGRGFLTSVVVS